MEKLAHFLYHGKDRNELIVVLHGFARTGDRNRMAAVREVICKERPDADIFAPELPVAKNKLCQERAESIARLRRRRHNSEVYKANKPTKWRLCREKY